MKKTIIQFLVIITIVFVFIGCNDDNSEKNPIKGKVTYNSGCKGNAFKNNNNDTTNIFNQYVNANTLFIEKTNWIYSCGEDSLLIKTSISNDTLYLYESWYYSDNCDCLRDIHYQVNNIPKGNYIVNLIHENRYELRELRSMDSSMVAQNPYYTIGPDYLYFRMIDTIFNINIQ